MVFWKGACVLFAFLWFPTSAKTAPRCEPKVDILFVIDNSGSMESSQRHLADNLLKFIESLSSKAIDYQIGVTTTDAYLAVFRADPRLSQLRDGNRWEGASGHPTITPSTPNLIANFMMNVRQGIYGSGDERAFQSLRLTLRNPLNNGFVRPDAFLAIFIVSDEDDFSHDGVEMIADRSDTRLHGVQDTIADLENIKPSPPWMRRFSVSTLSIQDETCLHQLSQESTATRLLGLRYRELASLSGGVSLSLCSNFGESLTRFAEHVVERLNVN